jgi:hypothetical protein
MASDTYEVVCRCTLSRSAADPAATASWYAARHHSAIGCSLLPLLPTSSSVVRSCCSRSTTLMLCVWVCERQDARGMCVAQWG